MQNLDHFDPREERYAKQELPSRTQSYKRPWHLKGWVWMIVAFLSLSALLLAIVALADQIAQVNGSIRSQTEVLGHQNAILASLSHGVQQIATAITYGVDRIIAAIGNL